MVTCFISADDFPEPCKTDRDCGFGQICCQPTKTCTRPQDCFMFERKSTCYQVNVTAMICF